MGTQYYPKRSSLQNERSTSQHLVLQHHDYSSNILAQHMDVNCVDNDSLVGNSALRHGNTGILNNVTSAEYVMINQQIQHNLEAPASINTHPSNARPYLVNNAKSSTQFQVGPSSKFNTGFNNITNNFLPMKPPLHQNSVNIRPTKVANPYFVPSADIDNILADRLNTKRHPNNSNSSFNNSNQQNSQAVTTYQIRTLDDDVLSQPEVLFHWISIEDNYLPSASYFSCIQSEIQPYMRKTLVTWMLEVCEELKRRKDVFHLAVNYLDRFLSSINTPKNHLQLLGSACMLLASKFKEAHPLSSEILILYTDNSITLPDLLKWEILVSSILNWDIAAPTCCMILELLVQTHPLFQKNSNSSYYLNNPVQLTTPAPINSELITAMHKTSQFFLDKCALESEYAALPPSMMASACLSISYIMFSYQYNPTFTDTDLFQFLEQVTKLTNIELDMLKNLITVIGNYLESFYQTTPGAPSSINSPNDSYGNNTQSSVLSSPSFRANYPTDSNNLTNVNAPFIEPITPPQLNTSSSIGDVQLNYNTPPNSQINTSVIHNILPTTNYLSQSQDRTSALYTESHETGTPRPIESTPRTLYHISSVASTINQIGGQRADLTLNLNDCYNEKMGCANNVPKTTNPHYDLLTPESPVPNAENCQTSATQTIIDVDKTGPCFYSNYYFDRETAMSEHLKVDVDEGQQPDYRLSAYLDDTTRLALLNNNKKKKKNRRIFDHREMNEENPGSLAVEMAGINENKESYGGYPAGDTTTKFKNEYIYPTPPPFEDSGLGGCSTFSCSSQDSLNIT